MLLLDLNFLFFFSLILDFILEHVGRDRNQSHAFSNFLLDYLFFAAQTLSTEYWWVAFCSMKTIFAMRLQLLWNSRWFYILLVVIEGQWIYTRLISFWSTFRTFIFLLVWIWVSNQTPIWMKKRWTLFWCFSNFFGDLFNLCGEMSDVNDE